MRCEVLMTIESLVDAKTAAAYCRVSEDVLLGWTASRHAPHYYLDGAGPLYKRTEIRKWVEANLMRHCEGMPVPRQLEVLKAVNGLTRTAPPLSIALLGNLLHVPITATCSGVYFLCADDEVVYVGQALHVISRIANHICEGVKQFDLSRVYFLPCPVGELNEVERQWIQALKPRYNRHGLPRSHAQACEPA